MSGLGLVLSLPSVTQTVEAARQAEQAGFESVWATEFTDRSATVAMAAMAAATERITIGSAIAYAFGRTPLVSRRRGARPRCALGWPSTRDGSTA